MVGEIRTGLGMAALGEKYRGGGKKASEPKPLTAKNICPKCGAKRIDNQLGLEKTPEEFVENCVKWAREVWRILRIDGTFFLNLGDSYWGGKGQSGQGSPEYHAARTDSPITKPQSNIAGHGKIRPQDGKHETLKPKDLCEIPSDVVRALRADGWWLRSRIPWLKRSAMPESCTDRPASALEYMFLLTKSGTSQYWTHRDFIGVREIPKPDWRWQHQAEGIELEEAPPSWGEMLIPCPDCDGAGYEDRFENTDLFGEVQTTWGSICENCKETEYIIDDIRCIKEWKRINLWQGHDYFFDMKSIRKNLKQSSIDRISQLTFNSQRGGSKDPRNGGEGSRNRSARQGLENLKESFENGNGRNFRNTDLFYQSLEEPHGAIFAGEEMVGLDVNPYSYKDAHFATFPPKLVEPCIKAGTSEKGACPECGAPWERILSDSSGGAIGKAWLDHEQDNERGAAKTVSSNGYQSGKTIGWQPTCKCGHKETVPCIVLDNFGGSGTTKNVADRLGRRGVMCELKMEYIEMAKKRCYQEPSLF